MGAPREPDFARRQAARRKSAERRGRRAEWLAAVWLVLTGHRLLARRYRAAGGEIDILAARGALVIAVEVKARARHDDGVRAVSPAARRRIETAARQFLARHGKPETRLRYDLITLAGWRLRHHRDAWRAGD